MHDTVFIDTICFKCYYKRNFKNFITMEKISLISLVTTPNLGWSVMVTVVAVVVLSAVFRKHLFHNDENSYTSPDVIQGELFEQLHNFWNLIDEKLVIKCIEVVDFKTRKKFTAYVYFCIEDDTDVLYKTDIINTEGIKDLSVEAKNLLKSKRFSFNSKGELNFYDEHITDRTRTQIKVLFLDSGSPITKNGEDYLDIPDDEDE